MSLQDSIEATMEEVSQQIAAAAPNQDCPRCGRRMQLLAVTPTSYSYVCYAHSSQNADGSDPFYLNVHHKFLDKDGKVNYAPDRPGR